MTKIDRFGCCFSLELTILWELRGMDDIKTLTFIPIKIALIILVIIFFQVLYFLQSSNTFYLSTSSPPMYDELDVIGYLEIPKINMKLPFYAMDDSRNDVNQNIEVLASSKEGRLVIAGHSGVGKVSFFNDLKDLNLGDVVYIFYGEEQYIYHVQDIYREIKNGYIHINEAKNEEILILTTCDQINKGYQLIIKAVLV